MAKAKKSKFRKTGGGSFYLNNRIIKPGQTFEAYKEDIPESFLDVLVCIKEGDAKPEGTSDNQKGASTYALQAADCEENAALKPILTKLKKVKKMEKLNEILSVNETTFEALANSLTGKEDEKTLKEKMQIALKAQMLYNIVDANGAVITEEALSEEEAEQMLKDLL